MLADLDFSIFRLHTSKARGGKKVEKRNVFFLPFLVSETHYHHVRCTHTLVKIALLILEASMC